MSNVVTTPFPIEPTSNGMFAVNLDGNIVNVQTRPEAELLASLSVEHSKMFTDIAGKPNEDRVRKIVQICKAYNYSSAAQRQLDSWLTEATVSRESFQRLISSTMNSNRLTISDKDHFKTDEARDVMRRVANDRDVAPGALCDVLNVPARSSYAQLVQRLMKWIASDSANFPSSDED